MNVSDLGNTNTTFRNMSRVEALRLVYDLRRFCIPYRDTLGLPRNCTFGIEIEYEDVDKEIIDKVIREFINWRSITDETLDSGGEIVTSRLHDEKRVWANLRVACQYLKMYNANTCKNAGIHVHVGSHILKNYDCWRKFLKLYAAYELVIIRFAYGDKLNPRSSFLFSAAPVALTILETRDSINSPDYLKKIDTESSMIKGHKTVALNIRGVDDVYMEGNTVEYRAFNSTVQAPIVQNYVNMATKIMLAASNPNLNESFLDAKLDNLAKRNLSYSAYQDECNKVLFEDALEFADIVFHNDLDKMCFFKQYFKDLECLKERSLEAVFARSLRP